MHVRGYAKSNEVCRIIFRDQTYLQNTKCHCSNNQVKHVNIPMSLTDFEW